jgi:hypothetical protein
VATVHGHDLGQTSKKGNPEGNALFSQPFTIPGSRSSTLAKKARAMLKILARWLSE